MRLKNVARFGYGDSLPAEDRVSGNFHVYGSNGIVGENDMPNTKGPCLIVGRKGSYGKVQFSEKPCFAIDTTYFIDSSLSKNNLRWLFYSLQWLQLDSFTKDSAVPGLSREDAYENILPFCHIKEQSAIATFLDRETGKIDRLIALKERQIELLQEKRTALISHVATKGLNPNAKMKDSGIEWLGEVPERWEIVPLRWYLRISSGEWLNNSEFMVEKTIDLPYPVIGGNGVMGYTAKSNIIGTTIAIGRVGAHCGNVHLITPPAWITDNALMLKSVREFNLDYLFFFLQSINLNRLANQNAQPLVTGTMVKSQNVILPPSEEQKKIIRFIRFESSKIEKLISKIQNIISLLREYRTALISAAVTGKIDVRQEVLDE